MRGNFNWARNLEHVPFLWAASLIFLLDTLKSTILQNILPVKVPFTTGTMVLNFDGHGDVDDTCKQTPDKWYAKNCFVIDTQTWWCWTLHPELKGVGFLTEGRNEGTSSNLKLYEFLIKVALDLNEILRNEMQTENISFLDNNEIWWGIWVALWLIFESNTIRGRKCVRVRRKLWQYDLVVLKFIEA